MTTRLMIMRHATTGWATFGQSDHDRELTDYGREETPKMAKVLQEMDWIPDLALVSSSTRTRETFSLLMPVPHEIRDEIYRASLDTLLSFVDEIDQGKTTLIVGHNPGCELLISTLSGVFHEVPPATCALFSNQDGNWVLEKVLRTAGLD
ncbi:MAG: histidine phosphatase family protein [Candidatus Thermoplasmatota archaeon]|nr:histidine phosphatase family protein [Candidatus Thermoplasmatota archaeon]